MPWLPRASFPLIILAASPQGTPALTRTFSRHERHRESHCNPAPRREGPSDSRRVQIRAGRAYGDEAPCKPAQASPESPRAGACVECVGWGTGDRTSGRSVHSRTKRKKASGYQSYRLAPRPTFLRKPVEIIGRGQRHYFWSCTGRRKLRAVHPRASGPSPGCLLVIQMQLGRL
jgi:hypothetical protein